MFAFEFGRFQGFKTRIQWCLDTLIGGLRGWKTVEGWVGWFEYLYSRSRRSCRSKDEKLKTSKARDAQRAKKNHFIPLKHPEPNHHITYSDRHISRNICL